MNSCRYTTRFQSHNDLMAVYASRLWLFQLLYLWNGKNVVQLCRYVEVINLHSHGHTKTLMLHSLIGLLCQSPRLQEEVH